MCWRCFDCGTHNYKPSVLQKNFDSVAFLSKAFSPPWEEPNWELQQELRTAFRTRIRWLLGLVEAPFLPTPVEKGEGSAAQRVECGWAASSEGEDVEQEVARN